MAWTKNKFGLQKYSFSVNFWYGPGREKSFDTTEKSVLNLAKLPSLSWFVENRQRCSSEKSPTFTDQFVRLGRLEAGGQVCALYNSYLRKTLGLRTGLR